jgi:hypothetical protein
MQTLPVPQLTQLAATLPRGLSLAWTAFVGVVGGERGRLCCAGRSAAEPAGLLVLLWGPPGDGLGLSWYLPSAHARRGQLGLVHEYDQLWWIDCETPAPEELELGVFRARSLLDGLAAHLPGLQAAKRGFGEVLQAAAPDFLDWPTGAPPAGNPASALAAAVTYIEQVQADAQQFRQRLQHVGAWWKELWELTTSST